MMVKWKGHLESGKCPKGSKEGRRGKSGKWCRVRGGGHMGSKQRPKLSGKKK